MPLQHSTRMGWATDVYEKEVFFSLQPLCPLRFRCDNSKSWDGPSLCLKASFTMNVCEIMQLHSCEKSHIQTRKYSHFYYCCFYFNTWGHICMCVCAVTQLKSDTPILFPKPNKNTREWSGTKHFTSFFESETNVQTHKNPSKISCDQYTSCCLQKKKRE